MLSKNTKPKRKRCKQCGEPFQPYLTTATTCSYQCAIKYTSDPGNRKMVIEKAKKDDRKETKSKLRQSNRESLKWQHDATQKAFNKMRVLQEKLWFKERGLEPECISCGKTNMDWCCGHFKTRGSQRELAYDEKNTYLQCNRYCNKGLSGNINGNKTTRGYIQGLKDRFGDKKADEIIEYVERVRVKKWTWQELEEMRKGFNAEIRKLEKLL